MTQIPRRNDSQGRLQNPSASRRICRVPRFWYRVQCRLHPAPGKETLRPLPPREPCGFTSSELSDRTAFLHPLGGLGVQCRGCFLIEPGLTPSVRQLILPEMTGNALHIRPDGKGERQVQVGWTDFCRKVSSPTWTD